jgi:hypothetical protein
VGLRVVALVLILVGLATGCTLPARFDAIRNELAALPVPAPPPSLDPLRRYRGVIHVHSHRSHDSRGRDEEIVRAAQAAGLDFVMMTDHNHPDLFHPDSNDPRDGVLVIRGAEIRTEDDYVLALGIDSFINPDGLSFADVTAAIAAQGGVAIGAHPSRFRHWSDSGLAGVEIWDLYDDATRSRWRYPGMALDVLISSRRYPAEILLSQVRHPDRALAAFDAETQRRRLTAIGTPDAHQNVRVWGRQLDPYPLTFRLAVTYLLAEEPTTAVLLDALRRGRAYFAFDLLASAGGFDFRLVDRDGASRMMGDRVVMEKGMTLRVVAPHRGRITVLRDGAVVHQLDAATLDLSINAPGVYRAEVALAVQGGWRPWIYSNPIYVL